MTDEEYIIADKILQNLFGNKRYCNHIDRFAKNVLKTRHEQTSRLIQFLKEWNAIEPWNGMHRLTKTGIIIATCTGGTKAYIENLERNKQSQIKEENKEVQKRKNERILSKWKVWTFWPAFIRKMLPLFLLLLAILLTISRKTETKKQEGISNSEQHILQQEQFSPEYASNSKMGETISDISPDNIQSVGETMPSQVND